MAINSISDIKEQNDYVIYSRDVVHKHSPAIREFLDLFLHHIEHAEEEAKQGKKVVFYSTQQYFPLAYAADTIPIYPPEMARTILQQDTNRAVDDLMIPEETCNMVKQMFGGYYKWKDSAIKTIVTDGIHCQPQHTAIVNMTRFGYTFYLMDDLGHPLTKDPDRIQRQNEITYKELVRLADFLTDGKGIDPAKLQFELDRANRINEKGQLLQQLQRKHKSYMRSLPTMLILSGCEHYMGQPEKFEEILDKVIAEFQNLPEDAWNDDLVPLVWSGPRGVDFSVYHSVDVSGGFIQAWWGPIGKKKVYPKLENPLEAWFDEQSEHGEVLGIKESLNGIEERFKKTGCKGIIVFITLGCTRATINNEVKRRYLTDKNIPSISIAGGGQVGDAAGQVLTRIKAFVEMVS